MNSTNEYEIIQRLLKEANSKLSLRKYSEAEELLKKGEAIDSENPEILYSLCVVHFQQHKYSETIINLKKILDLPFTTVNGIDIKKLLCITYLKTENLEKCSSILLSLVNTQPNDISILSILAYYYEKIGKLEQSIAIHTKILEIDKSNLNSHNAIAYLLAIQNIDLNKALSSARFAYNKQPENSAYSDTLGYVHLQRNELDMAKKYLKKAIELNPDSFEIRSHLNELLNI